MAESTKLEDILAQARALNSSAMSLPKPPNTGSTWKDFLLNALQTAPMALGAKTGPGARITGGRDYGLMDGVYSQIHNPGSAKDLGLHPAIKFDLGVPQVNANGIAENANVYNPKVNDVLNYLSKRDLPVVGVKDPPGGTTYVTTQNPTRPEGKNEIRIRIPEPGNEHPPRGDVTFKFQQRNGPGSFFDVNPKGLTGIAGRILKENESGGKYNDLNNLYSAIDKVTGRKLVEEGKGPILSKPAKPEAPAQTVSDPNQLGLELQGKNQPSQNDLHALIDKELYKFDSSKYPIATQPKGAVTETMNRGTSNSNLRLGETPKTFDELVADIRADPRMKDIWNIIDKNNAAKQAGNMEQPNLTIDQMKSQSRFASDPNPVMPEQGAQMHAANSVATPRVNDPLLEAMNKTDNGKYQLALYRQKLKEQGKDPTGMSLMDIYKELNPDLFTDR